MAGIVVAVDVGGSYVKATAFDLATGRFDTSGQAVPVISPQPGFLERDPEALWQAAAECIRSVLATLGRSGRDVRAVGLTGHGNGAHLVDASGRPTRNAILATDTRAAELVHGWVAEGRADELRPHAWASLWAGMTGPVLAWLARHDQPALDGATSVLGAKDYLRARLTGVVSAEITQASTCGMYDNAVLVEDPGLARLQPGELALGVFGLERYRRLFPESVGSLELFEVSADAAALTGLAAGTPVVAGLVDNPAAQHGSGVFDSSMICVGAGTWSINQLLTPVSEMTADGLLARVAPYSASMALGAHGLLCEASPTSASTFSWALERAVTASSSADQAEGRDPYQSRLEREHGRPRRPDDPIFLPYVNGSREDAQARGAWLGLSLATSEDDLLGAVLEGICMEHRRHVERLEVAIGRRLPVRLSGGPTKSPEWCQLFADVLGRPVEVSPVAELGCLAVAAMAATAVGDFASVPAAVTALGSEWRTFTPDDERTSFFEHRWHRYRTWAERFEHEPWGASA